MVLWNAVTTGFVAVLALSVGIQCCLLRRSQFRYESVLGGDLQY